MRVGPIWTHDLWEQKSESSIMPVFNIKPGSGHIITFAYQADHFFIIILYTEIYLNDLPSQSRVILALALCTVKQTQLYVLYPPLGYPLVSRGTSTFKRGNSRELANSLHFNLVIRHARRCKLHS